MFRSAKSQLRFSVRQIPALRSDDSLSPLGDPEKVPAMLVLTDMEIDSSTAAAYSRHCHK
jgi:hypothetical protein